MTLRVRGPNGKDTHLTALVDTGAQANLIKTGLVANLATPCKKTLRLVTANGDVLPGGDTEVDLMVHFRERGVDVGPGEEMAWRAKGCFH